MSDTPPIASETDLLTKQIEELNLEKQQLISLVSHDLRSPLNRAFALAELLLMDAHSLNDFQKDYLEKMRLVIADGLAMMRNLVDYRNLEFRNIDVMPEPVNITEFLDKLIRDFQSIADKKRITIQTIHTATDITIASDKQCLDRVLGNLLSNALKFSNPGQKVLIRTLKTEQGVEIQIEDEVGGFSDAEKATLFTKFKRYRARPTGNESSTGLGLYIASAMATRMGAVVTCQTTEGKGSTFTVLLPAEKR